MMGKQPETGMPAAPREPPEPEEPAKPPESAARPPEWPPGWVHEREPVEVPPTEFVITDMDLGEMPTADYKPEDDLQLDLTKAEKVRATALVMAIRYQTDMVIRDAELYRQMRKNKVEFTNSTVDLAVMTAMKFEQFLLGNTEMVRNTLASAAAPGMAGSAAGEAAADGSAKPASAKRKRTQKRQSPPQSGMVDDNPQPAGEPG